MAVYTNISLIELNEFLDLYSIGKADDLVGIKSGIENTNYLVKINNQKYIFQKFLSKARLNAKFTPKINFYLDDSFDEAEKIEKLLLNKDVQRDLDG